MSVQQVYRYQSPGQGVNGESGFRQGYHSQQAGLTLVCEYDRRVELPSFQPYHGIADVD